MKFKFLPALAFALLGTFWAGSAAAFPDRPVRIVLPYPSGTSPDTVMRKVAEKLAVQWKQPVIIENRPGANGWIAVEAVRRAAPDGYTLLLADATLMVLHPHLFKKIPFDPAKDFEPVAALFRTYYFVTVSANSEWTSLSQMITTIKARPGKVNYGSPGVGSANHLGGEMLQKVTATKMAHIPYKETMSIYTDIVRGDVNWTFATPATTLPFYQAHKIKYLAVAAPERSKAFPDVPTVREIVGAQGFDLQTWIALFTPRGTPLSAVEKMNSSIKRELESPEMQSQFKDLSIDPFLQTPAKMQSTIKADSEKYANVVKELNISLD